MDFNDTLLTSKLVLESDAVPLIVGHTGIGKTALLQQLAIDIDAHLITIDANLLKEGEIGGLPTLEDHPFLIDKEESMRKVTVYALHYKLLEVAELLTANPRRQIILFIDELNRCEHVVQQELMNLILNREINGFKIPPHVLVVAAMNPSSKYETYAESYYQVVDMDPAQEDRFVWIEMEAHPTAWLNWGSAKGNIVNGEKVTKIHPDILEFIATFPEYLQTLNSAESIKASPRGWERVSNSYYVYLESKPKYPHRIFFHVVKGNVGLIAAQEFLNFLENCKNPLLKPQDIFASSKLSPDILAEIRLENHSRLYLISKHCLDYLAELSFPRQEYVEIFCQILKLYPPDLKMAVMQDIKLNYPENLYAQFLQVASFVDDYFQLYSYIA